MSIRLPYHNEKLHFSYNVTAGLSTEKRGNENPDGMVERQFWPKGPLHSERMPKALSWSVGAQRRSRRRWDWLLVTGSWRLLELRLGHIRKGRVRIRFHEGFQGFHSLVGIFVQAVEARQTPQGRFPEFRFALLAEGSQ